MREENVKIVEMYINALKNKNLDSVQLADEMIFEDPVAGRNTGAENFRAFLSGFLPSIKDVKIIRHICEDDFVVTQFEVETVFGTIPILEKFRIKNGEITEAEGYFDPRPILG